MYTTTGNFQRQRKTSGGFTILGKDDSQYESKSAGGTKGRYSTLG